MKRLRLLGTALCCAALAMPAAYADTSGIRNQVPILDVSDAYGSVTSLTDDNPLTAWYGANADRLTLLIDGQTVREIWIRNGLHSNSSAYLQAGRPSQIAVEIAFGNRQTVVYRYRLDDTYAGSSASRNWFDGYQRLLLPEPLRNVSSVTLTMEAFLRGQAGYPPALSDVVLSSGQPSSRPPGVVFYPSAPTAAPTSAPTALPPVMFSDVIPPQPTGQPTVALSTLPPTAGTVGILAPLLERIATRTGPGTLYDEPGSFLQAGDMVRVVSKAWDMTNQLYWLQVNFTANGVRYRVYTPAQRVAIDLSAVPDDPAGMPAVVLERSSLYYGPGVDYLAHTDTVASGMAGTVYTVENDWALFEWYDSYQSLLRRAWVPTRVIAY